jgi:hypothetical protein
MRPEIFFIEMVILVMEIEAVVDAICVDFYGNLSSISFILKIRFFGEAFNKRNDFLPP